MRTLLSNIRLALVIGITISILTYIYLFIPLWGSLTSFQTNSVLFSNFSLPKSNSTRTRKKAKQRINSSFSTSTHSIRSILQTAPPVETIDLAHVWRTYAGTSRIPFIVHQTYKNTDLLAPYYMSLLGLLRTHRFRDPRRHALSSSTIYAHNQSVSGSSQPQSKRDVAIEHVPRYDYYFWSDTSIAEFVADNEKRPEFRVFKTLRVKLETSDAIRYFALYEYGGIYLDMDIEVVRPLAPFLARSYACAVSQENPIQSGGPRITNCFLLCRARHPFMKMMVDSMPEFQTRRGGANERTGPNFIWHVVHKYLDSPHMRRLVLVNLVNASGENIASSQNTTNTSTSTHSTLSTISMRLRALCAVHPWAHADCLYLAPPHLFDSLDMPRLKAFLRRCDEFFRRFAHSRPATGSWDLRVLEHCEHYRRAMEETGSKAHLVPPAPTSLEHYPDGEGLLLKSLEHLKQVPPQGRADPTWPDVQRGAQEAAYAVHHYLHIGAYQIDGGLARAPLTHLLHGYWMYRRGQGMTYNAG